MGGELQRMDNVFQLFDFNLKPLELKLYLDKFVVGQEEAKKTVSTVLCTHYNRLRNDAIRIREGDISQEETVRNKSNMMMIGNTGTGKTLLLTLAADYIGIPVHIDDATKLTATGYVGEDVEEVVRKLYHVSAKGNLELAELGIVYIDEIDKIARIRDGRDIVGGSVQEELLRIIEGTIVELHSSHSKSRDYAKQMRTDNILFVFSGAFDGLEDIVQRRLKKQMMGFGANIQQKDSQEGITLEDLKEYGMDSQFLGRIPNIVSTEPLDAKRLYAILTLPTSKVISTKIAEFESYGIHLDFQDEALMMIAEEAGKLPMGGRSLNRVVNTILSDFLFYLPSTNVDGLTVTRQVVQDPKGALEEILNGNPLVSNEGSSSKGKSVPLLAHDTAPQDEYARKLEELDLHPQFLEIAIDYGLRNALKPFEVVNNIKRMHNEIRAYEESFRSEYGVRLAFSKILKSELIFSAIQEDNLHMKGMIKSLIGTHIEDKDFTSRYHNKQVTLHSQILEDPLEYVLKLMNK